MPLSLRNVPLLLPFMLGACVPPPGPAPAPSQPAAAHAAATPAADPAASQWTGSSRTAGDWEWRNAAGASTASFRDPAGRVLAGLRCDRGARAIELLRAGRSGTGRLELRSEAQQRVLTAVTPADGDWTIARLPANDTLWDAVAFSRGHFTIVAGGLPDLHLPSYPELTRVVEDCR